MGSMKQHLIKGIKTKLSSIIILVFFFSLNVSADSIPLNINNKVKTAIINNKQVMIFFHMTHCGYCKRMEKKTLQEKKIKEFTDEHFELIDINIDDNEKILLHNVLYTKRDLAATLDVDFFPTIIFLDEDLEITYTARGYRKSKKFLKILEYIQTKSFENIDFFDYEKEEKE